MLAFRLAALAALALPAWADIVPTSPSGGTVVQVGQDIQALWNEDTTGAWTDVEIQLMTGDNLQMVALATVATGIDGTTTDSLNIPCPDVSPYSKIYFLQFTRGGDVSTATWTTRFTIASASGETVPPEQSTVYNGESVQWGTGALVNAAPAPITGTGSSSNSTGTSSGSTNGTDAGMASAMMSSSTGPARVTTMSTMASASATDDSAVNAAAVSSGSMSAASSVRSGSATPASASPSASQSGAALKGSTVGLGAVVLGLAGLVAL